MTKRIARPSKFILAALAAAALAAPPAVAQQQESKDTPVSQVVRKGKAPVSGEVLRVKLPAAKEFTLSNGLTVLMMEDHRFPAVTTQFLIAGSGGLNEPRELPGLAWMTAQMLTEGTKKRSSRELTEEVARLGATLNAGAGFGSEGASISASGLSDNFDEWFALVVEVLLEPNFPAQELQRLVGRTKVNLRQQRAQPNFLVNERFSRAVYGSHPAAVISTTPEALDQLTPERLAAWHRERYVPQNAILGVAGDVNAEALKAKLEKWLAAWKRTDQPDVLPPDPKPVAKKQIHLVDRPKSEQTTLWLGNIAIKRTDPDYPAMVVMNRVVGGGASARLFLNLREEKGYTYGAYSTLQAERYAGPWRAFANVRTEVTEGAMTEFLNEINRIRNEKVPAAELEEAKRAMVANFALSLEQPAQLLSYAITRKIYNLPADYWEKYPAQLLAVSADDVQRVARKYINPDALQIAAVGDASRIREVMEKFGPVVMYDAEGKPVAEAAASAAAPGR